MQKQNDLNNSKFTFWSIGVIFGLVLLLSLLTFAYTESIIIDQTLDEDWSYQSHYEDNWYQLGRGVPIIIRTLTIRGYTTPYAQQIYLLEFKDSDYTSLSNHI